MTTRVYLHVGAPKSGTTYLQRVLDANRAAARRPPASCWSASATSTGSTPPSQVREDQRLGDAPRGRTRTPGPPSSRQIQEWQGESAVLSYELFAAASAEQAQRALADLAAYDVHVVVTARDLGRVGGLGLAGAPQVRAHHAPRAVGARRRGRGRRVGLAHAGPRGRRRALGLDPPGRPRPRRHRTPSRRRAPRAVAPLRRRLRAGRPPAPARRRARQRVARGGAGRAAAPRERACSATRSAAAASARCGSATCSPRTSSARWGTSRSAPPRRR